MELEQLGGIMSIIWVLCIVIGVYLWRDGARIEREWRRLQEQLDERFKAFAATRKAPFIPVVSTAWGSARSPQPAGVMRGEVALSEDSVISCEIICPDEFDCAIYMTYSTPRRGRFHDLSFVLDAEGMKLSLKGQVYALSLAQAKLVFETLDLEPWPEAIKVFTYDHTHIELTLLCPCKELKSAEMLVLIDELWAQCSSYFERFLARDIDHSKAPLLEAALELHDTPVTS